MASSQHASSLQNFLPKGMSPEQFYTIVAVGIALVCVAVVFLSLRRRQSGMGARVKGLQERRSELRAQLLVTPGRQRPEGGLHLMRSVAERFNLLKQSQIGHMQTLLIEAGWRSKDALVIYAFFSLISPLLFLAIGLLMLPTVLAGVKFVIIKLGVVLFLTYFGLKFPTWVVKRRRKKRYANIQRSLADTLDLMTICAEAGLSLSASVDRVSKDLAIAYPDMADELSLTSLEMGFLPDRNKALTNWSDRVQMPEIRGIVSVLVQTEKYGTPIAQALRVFGTEFRTQRMLRAEAKAARLPALMTVPMIVFILPTLFIVIISPAIIKMMDSW